jgi:hypothetical protein
MEAIDMPFDFLRYNKGMKTISALIFLAMAVLFSVPACTPGDLRVSTGKEFTLAPGQAAALQGENLSLKFEGVTGDSRCPRDVQCIWAGEVTSQVIATLAGSSSTLTIVQGGGSNGARTIIGGFEMTTKVEPYPVSSQKIPARDYRLTVIIRKL